jgi:triacylglycerol lipase
VLLVAGAVAGTALARDRPGDGEPKDPILFVHGFSSNGSVWDTMADRFAGDGWPRSHLDAWEYDSGGSNLTTARRLAGEVERLLAATGREKVDVVTHSMGGLPARLFLKELGGTSRVDAWVSLGGPNHGTDTAGLYPQTASREMRIGSPFLAALNDGDETPGPVRYATWWSPCDTIINPDTSVALDGAKNTKTACLAHGELLSDPVVYAQVRDFVHG